MNRRPSTAVVLPKLAYPMKEASEVSGLSRSTLYELISSGRLKAVKVGGRRLILHSDLLALFDAAKLEAA